MKFIALTTPLLLLGCATSQSDVETEDRRQVFVVDQKVDDVYYQLTSSLEPGTTCEDLSVARPFYYPEKDEFSISWGILLPLGGGPFVIAVVKGKGVTGAQTEVTYLESRGTLPGVYSDVKNFVRGGHCTKSGAQRRRRSMRRRFSNPQLQSCDHNGIRPSLPLAGRDGYRREAKALGARA